MFGTTSVPMPDILVSSVRRQYRYPQPGIDRRLYRNLYRYRYNVDAGTGHFGTFGTTSTGTATYQHQSIVASYPIRFRA